MLQQYCADQKLNFILPEVELGETDKFCYLSTHISPSVRTSDEVSLRIKRVRLAITCSKHPWRRRETRSAIKGQIDIATVFLRKFSSPGSKEERRQAAMVAKNCQYTGSAFSPILEKQFVLCRGQTTTISRQHSRQAIKKPVERPEYCHLERSYHERVLNQKRYSMEQFNFTVWQTRKGTP